MWFLLGEISAFSLVGDISIAYPASCFGPFNVYDKMDDKDEARKINARRKFFLRLGGVCSILFMFVFYIYTGIKKGIKHLIWIFS